MKNIIWKKNMKFLKENKKGLCSIQIAIILMASIIFCGYILESASMGIKTIARRSDAVEDKVLGENIFQIADIYVIEEFEDLYNSKIYKIIKNFKTNDEVRITTFRSSCFGLWATGIKNIGTKLSTSKLLKTMKIKYITIDSEIYVYDKTPYINYFVLQNYLDPLKIEEQKDFAIEVWITVKKDEFKYVYKKSYIFDVPFYEDEMIEKIRKNGDGPKLEKFFILDQKNIISSEITYEKYRE